MKTTPESKYFTKKGVKRATENISVEGVKFLRAKRVERIYELKYELSEKTNTPIRMVSKKLIDENVKELSFEFKEVTPEQLADYRKKGRPSFVLKKAGKLYYTEIPRDISFVGSKIVGRHMCAIAGKECRRLLAARDEEGGCAKVRNKATYIERYPWITDGYETFNTNKDSFVVGNCKHYEPCPPRKNLTAAEVNRAKLGLAQFYWDDVETLKEVRDRKKRLTK